MENTIQVKPVGFIKADKNGFSVELEKTYLPALKNIDGFSHLQIVWWGNLCDTPEYRSVLTNDKPYKKGPDTIGIFATRSPIRPNPVLITTIYVQHIDFEKGIIYTPYIDAEKGSPVLDIKPYHLSDRVRSCQVPSWCQHWPEWDEDSAEFDWQNEFNF
ncbi:MAG: SAM-dependent methyltransferase [Bacteroidales bacterium]|nr:SAM-dependent methyltransferase [Bacteroidales bacterium]MBN2761990.1 SAM-dependent methyltransferase [Bacteroidales bacterium]